MGRGARKWEEAESMTLVHILQRDTLEEPFPADFILEPRVPKDTLPGQNKTTPRISFAPDFSSAFVAIGLGSARLTRILQVYTNLYDIPVVVPTPRMVPDAKDTGEVWSLDPVKVRMVHLIQPEDVSYMVCVAAEVRNGIHEDYPWMSKSDMKREYIEQLREVWDKWGRNPSWTRRR